MIESIKDMINNNLFPREECKEMLKEEYFIDPIYHQYTKSNENKDLMNYFELNNKLETEKIIKFGQEGLKLLNLKVGDKSPHYFNTSYTKMDKHIW